MVEGQPVDPPNWKTQPRGFTLVGRLEVKGLVVLRVVYLRKF